MVRVYVEQREAAPPYLCLEQVGLRCASCTPVTEDSGSNPDVSNSFGSFIFALN